ncbi:unnamed protein product [Urochloa decumbens]|uniref:non-specific serine/threonine protein kinase n=1 Tax=Urochloa decumbens TaxID=240449 RepID=A0ABC9AEV1_9POAL
MASVYSPNLRSQEPYTTPKSNSTKPMQAKQSTARNTMPPLQLLPPFLLFPDTTYDAITLSITNRCSYTLWPAAVPVGGGVQLNPGKSWTLSMPAGTTNGRVWPRTGCLFNSAGTVLCQTGDCGGVLNCTHNGQPPRTVAEFSFGEVKETDFFDISLIEGFNVPMDFLPLPTEEQKGQGCSKGPRCAANITSQCPSQLKAPGGCNNACTVFNQSKYCCTGDGGKTCEPTTYSVFFIRMCPDAYSYSLNDSSNTMFTCPSGTNYQVVFCPPVDISVSPPTANTSAYRNSTTFPRRRVFGVVLGSVGSLIVMEEGDEEFGEIPGMPTRFTFQQLEEATNHFRNKLGEGGFGSVYEGQYGEEKIAVKRLDQAGQEKSHRLLVYEYMPKGSLDKWIYNRHDNDAPPLDWQTRRKIITHIAKGLSYLHEECIKRIAHLDVKPQNILLDENFNGKLSDFGLCKLIDQDKSQVITRMRGTPGYLASEWLTSQITEKADVYSFGIVVMEIISGRKNLDTSRSEESIHLITLLEEKVESNELADLIDKHSTDMQAHQQEVIQMMRLVMWCLQIDCKRRPQMSDVIKVLEGHMNAETEIGHKFVTTNLALFPVAKTLGYSDPPVASVLSGPR